MKTWKLILLLVSLLLVSILLLVFIIDGVTTAVDALERKITKADSANVVYSENFAIAKTTNPQEFLRIREEIRRNGYIVLNEAIIRLNSEQLCYIIEWELQIDPFVDDNEGNSWEEENLPEDKEKKEGELRFLLLGIFIQQLQI